MKEKIHIWPNAAEVVDDQVIFSAVIELPSGEKQSLWYRIPLEWASSLTDKADPFLIASIFGAMVNRADIHVHGKVSRSLLANLENYQSVWKTWKPDLWDIAEIFVDEELDSDFPSKEDIAILPFSGGVDCSFTAYRHTHNLAGRNNCSIGAGLMVHGFDIPLSNETAFEKAAIKAEDQLLDINLPLVRVSTNWRNLPYNKYVNWEDSHATALIAVASLFQKGFSKCLIASGDLSYTKIQWGSNALTDPMLSSDDFQIIYDGASFSRVKKVETIGDWQSARKNLRVCWQGKNPSENCCECEKCIRTILDFRVTGYGLPECFQKDVSDQQIMNVPIHGQIIFENLKSILDKARENNLGNLSWVKALEKRINWYKKPPFRQKVSSRLRRWRKTIKSTLSGNNRKR